MDRRRLNQIRGVSYLHLFDCFETCLAEAGRAQAMRDVETRDTLSPLLRLDALDHNALFQGFERAFPTHTKLIDRPTDLDAILLDAAPLSLLVLALHLKLVTQQHYLACVRGGEHLEPSFVRILREHWTMECGKNRDVGSIHSIQQALAAALPGRIPAALRDYKRLVFAIDDVLRRQSELDVKSLETMRGEALSEGDHTSVVDAQVAAQRNTFITAGIVNAAFVYSLKSLGPAAPAMLAGVVSALSSR